ncbi:DUF4190 domain-containing protein [Brachybacterium aquaticum]|uniref:DUF4190 domain-containing protein n=1 Tax=Brachybacterium aquaticum TaxID=1432564 RepID=A0A841A918_9MICO|nr:DUF4190 domain-containing protein [Brachybacterium aquaticum]MBB5830437.1 hypothetical protein [Brachybacterium aquaticum]
MSDDRGGYGAQDPYGSSDPYGQNSYGQGSSRQDPYAQDPYSSATSYGSSTPYGSPGAPGAHDPYAAPAPSADGFGPSFGSPSAAPAGAGGYAPVGYAPPMPTSGKGVAGFILGIASLLMCGGLTAPVGLVFSILGMRETGPSATAPKSGRGLAIAGLVLSILGCLVLLFLIAYFVLVIIVASTEGGY